MAGEDAVPRAVMAGHAGPLQRPRQRRTVTAPDHEYKGAGNRRPDCWGLVCECCALGLAVEPPLCRTLHGWIPRRRARDRHLLLSGVERRGLYCRRNHRPAPHAAESDDRRHRVRCGHLCAAEPRVSLRLADH